jgi:hypothetical protein
MRKLLLLLAVAAAFTFTAVAQTSGATSTTGDKATTTKKSTKAKAGAGADATATDTDKKASTKGGAAKGSTLTGCLAAGDTDTSFKLTNGRYKNGLAVEDSGAALKPHVGHTVKLTGTKTGDKFTATKVTHVADTCKAGGKKASAAKEGTEGAASTTASTGAKSGKKAGKKTGDMATTPK